jgi:O-acetylhomoserine/O-acetylserine sulfhydrylase-like pyridoxal-dependent enzyme
LAIYSAVAGFGLTFKKLGWKCHFVDPTDPENFRKALTPRVKAIFVENLANPRRHRSRSRKDGGDCP